MLKYLKLFFLTNLLLLPVLIGFEYIEKVIILNIPLSLNTLIGSVCISLIIGTVVSIFFYKYTKKLQLVHKDKYKEYLLRKEQEGILIQQSKMAAIGGTIAAIAHQWKQPLNVLTFLTVTMDKKAKADQLSKEFIFEIISQLDNQRKFMSTTIDDFSNFFNPDKKIVNFNVKDEIKNSLSIMNHVFKNYFIELDISYENAQIKGVKNEFQHVIINILNNAKDVLNERGIKNKKITINTFKDKKNVYIEIKDNGGGISEKNISKIFNPYFTTKGDKGTGIGLYMTQIILRGNLNGEIEVKNDDEGAVFVISLPLSCTHN